MINNPTFRKKKVLTEKELQEADLKTNPSHEEMAQLEKWFFKNNPPCPSGLVAEFQKSKLLRSKFKNVLKIGEVGLQVNHINTHKLASRAIKLISYDIENDEYRFQYVDKPGSNFLTVSGNAYPILVWRTDPTEVRTSVITRHQ